jgi:hypothetical protein
LKRSGKKLARDGRLDHHGSDGAGNKKDELLVKNSMDLSHKKPIKMKRLKFKRAREKEYINITTKVG